MTTTEFKRVQAAKVVHRMASGSHRRWEIEVADRHNRGTMKTRVTELHVFPRSRGRVLRHIGKSLEEAVDLLVDHHLTDLCDFKKRQDRSGVFGDRPYPKGIAAKKRREPR